MTSHLWSRLVPVTLALRVNDITGELEKRLDLGRQARKAEKYRKLKGEMREIELHAASHRFLELHAETKALQVRLESLGTEEREGLEQVRALEDSITQQRAKLEAEAGTLRELGDEAHALESQAHLSEQALEHATRDRAETEQRLSQVQAEIVSPWPPASRRSPPARGRARRSWSCWWAHGRRTMPAAGLVGTLSPEVCCPSNRKWKEGVYRCVTAGWPSS